MSNTDFSKPRAYKSVNSSESSSCHIQSTIQTTSTFNENSFNFFGKEGEVNNNENAFSKLLSSIKKIII